MPELEVTLPDEVDVDEELLTLPDELVTLPEVELTLPELEVLDWFCDCDWLFELLALLFAELLAELSLLLLLTMLTVVPWP